MIYGIIFHKTMKINIICRGVACNVSTIRCHTKRFSCAEKPDTKGYVQIIKKNACGGIFEWLSFIDICFILR